MSAVLIMLGSQSLAATLTVGSGGDYPTIQAAIDAASDGDRIEIAAGSYLESLEIDALNLTIAAASADPKYANQTTLWWRLICHSRPWLQETNSSKLPFSPVLLPTIGLFKISDNTLGKIVCLLLSSTVLLCYMVIGNDKDIVCCCVFI